MFRANRFSIPLLLAVAIVAACQAAPTAAPTALPATQASAPTAVAAAATTAPAADPSAANIAVVRRFYDEFSAGNADVILEVHPANVLMHYAGEAEEVPAQALRDDLAALKAANPDLHAEVHDIFGQGDIVVTELTWVTTHTGDYFGIPATGQTTAHPGIVIRRLENGKIVESWEMWDDLAFLHSIGYLASWDEIIADHAIEEAEAGLPPLAEDQALVTDAADMVGVWRGGQGSAGDPEQSMWWFKPDGTYQIAFTIEQLLNDFALERGTYTVAGGRMTLQPNEGSGCAEDPATAVGVHQARLARGPDGAPQRLRLLPLSDNCNSRKNGSRANLLYVSANP